MNYQAHYDRLIERARDRILAGYSERHHVVPKCLGGTNKASNLVRLTAEEHYVAHQLLVKIHPTTKPLIFAAIIMCGTTSNLQRSNKAFGWLRRKNARAAREFRHTPETIAKLSAGRMGAIVSQETRHKLANRKLRHTGATKAKMSKTRLRLSVLGSHHGFPKGHKLEVTTEIRASMSAGCKLREARHRVGREEGTIPKRTLSSATRARMSAAAIIREASRRAEREGKAA